MQHKAVLIEAFNALYMINKPGEIIDIPFRWKKEVYDNYAMKKLVNPVELYSK
jgi:D-proline reductase (dithiol) PrdB